jgi:predicted TIM-barrel fold metal-dependent hydrolase
MTAVATFGSYVSADSHVTEPPEVWTDRLPAAYRDRAPILAHPEGMGATIVIDPGGEGEQLVPFGRIAAAGRVLRGGEDGWSWDELHPGGYDAAARITEQQADGIAAEVIYPSVGMMLCNHPDLDYKRACFEAYNDWIAEWCAYAPDRLLGLGQTALRTPEEGIVDLERIKALGLRGVMLPGIPALEDYDSEIYDPFWDAVVDLGLPASFHILTAGGEKWWRGPNMNGFLGVIHANQDLIGMLVLGGVFERHPELKVVNVEADAGWAPHYMFRMDTLFERHHKWVPSGVLSRKPSEYFRDNVYMTFQDDRVAFQCVDMLEVGRLMWACDHPHSDSTWPHSQEVLELNAGNLTPEQLSRVVRDNCAELYGIDVDALARTGA